MYWPADAVRGWDAIRPVCLFAAPPWWKRLPARWKGRPGPRLSSAPGSRIQAGSRFPTCTRRRTSGGILTALRHSTAEWNLIVACDMPEIAADFLIRLLEEAARSRAVALIPAGPSGMPEPLCAVYHRSCRAALEQAFAGGVRKITDALAGVATVRLSVPEAFYFQNVNTPDDWSGYAAK